MDEQQFLAKFGYIAQAPNGIEKLRELVLVLAVQGRLVQQLPGEDAAEILGAIGKERESLIASRVVRSPKPLPEVTGTDRSHTVPANWCWTRFGEIALHNSGKTLDSVRNSGHPRRYITTSNLYWGRFDLSNVRQMLIRDEELEKCTARRGDLLICEGGEAGRAAVWVSDEEVCFQNHVHRARFLGEINPFYAYRFFEKLNKTGEINQHRKGIGISNMSSKALAMIAFPLPPLAEQDRIVAKVDELMALCDQLEQQQRDRRKLQNAMRQATMQAFASAQGPHELQTSWQRLQTNFGRLFSEPNDVRQLRDVLFDLSLRGLTLTSSKLSADSEERTTEFGSLPDGWSWKTLAELSEYITSGSRGWKAYISSAGDSFIRSQDIKQDSLVFENPVFVTLPDRTEGKRTLVREGDLLLTITGGNVGRCAAVHSLENTAYVSQHVALIRLRRPELFEFIHYWMINSYGGQAFLARYIYGDKPGLNLTQVGSVPIPIPPTTALPEILASLRKQQELCGELAYQLDARSEVASRLAAVGVTALTGINIEQAEDTAVKAPQTELIAPLRLATPPDVKAQAPLATILARHQGEMAARDLWQRFGGAIDAFYAQLKTEVAHGWIAEPEPAQVREKPTIEAAKV
jgi:type I restriction enzyme, S subunit